MLSIWIKLEVIGHASYAPGQNLCRISSDAGAQFTKYLTIYRKIIVTSTYDSDLKRAKTSFRNTVS